MAFRRLNDMVIVDEFCGIHCEDVCKLPYCYNEEYKCRHWVQIKKPNWQVKEEENMNGKDSIKEEVQPADIAYEKYYDLKLKYNKLKENLLDITNMYLELKRSQNG